MKYYHVDVFSSKPLSGNGLTVIFPQKPLTNQKLLEIAQELKQFESIFIYPLNSNGVYPARIFTVDEELMFAGHPILGAGAVIHKLFFPNDDDVKITFELGERHIQIQSGRKDACYQVTMNQGKAMFIKEIEKSCYSLIAKALNINEHDIDKNFPVEVVSTGLPYLLVPLQSNISNSKILHNDFKAFLSSFGAKFVYVFDTNTLECRTWDNFGNNEDVATGSAAGPLCAYLFKNKIKRQDELIDVHQGKYVNRPSIIKGWVSQNGDHEDVFITGEVSFFASGIINI